MVIPDPRSIVGAQVENYSSFLITPAVNSEVVEAPIQNNDELGVCSEYPSMTYHPCQPF